MGKKYSERMVEGLESSLKTLRMRKNEIIAYDSGMSCWRKTRSLAWAQAWAACCFQPLFISTVIPLHNISFNCCSKADYNVGFSFIAKYEHFRITRPPGAVASSGRVHHGPTEDNLIYSYSTDASPLAYVYLRPALIHRPKRLYQWITGD
jgi:hypothetical protein